MKVKDGVRSALKAAIAVAIEAVKPAALAVGYEVRRVPTEKAPISQAIEFLHSANYGAAWSRLFLSYAVKYLSSSHSQIMQDLFALSILREKRNGFFVEFGAGDGVTLSNSY